jgi:hypothetical protein
MANDGYTQYDKEYGKRPEQRANRAARGRARYAMEKELGAAKLRGKDVDHVRRLDKGGTNARSNLRLLSPTKNRGWRKGKSGYD